MTKVATMHIVKILKNLPLQNQTANKFETCYADASIV